MDQPRASRPYMPGYGIVGPTQGSGLLPWSWAEERLTASRNYWVASSWPDGRPHAMPVWHLARRGVVVQQQPAVAQGAQPRRRPALRRHH
jgi:hypothetical protein